MGTYRKGWLRDKLLEESHITKSNPNGAVAQCDRRDIHKPHEYQREFGSYFDVYCPGNDGKNP